MTTATLRLPTLLGTRTTVRTLVDELGDIDGVLVVQCRDILSIAQGATDELVRYPLSKGVTEVLFRAPTRDMREHLQGSAVALGVTDRVRVLKRGEYIEGEAG